jgi:hypothetical protein
MATGTVPLTIGGSYQGYASVVTVPSSLMFGALSTPGSINSLIQQYLGRLTDGITNDTVNFQDYDLGNGQDYIQPAAASVLGANSYELISNTDSTGGTTATSGGSYSGITVTTGNTDLLVQVPGDITLTGASSTKHVVFGAKSNVDYSVTDPTAGTMSMAGGANSVTLYNTSTVGHHQSVRRGHRLRHDVRRRHRQG